MQNTCLSLDTEKEISVCYIEKYYSELPVKEKESLAIIKSIKDNIEDTLSILLIKDRIVDYLAYNIDELEVDVLMLLNNIIKEIENLDKKDI